MAKIKYMKPALISLGQIAPVTGASACTIGTNPDVIPACQPGSSADSNCENGGVAGYAQIGNCSTGADNNWLCATGTSARFH